LLNDTKLSIKGKEKALYCSCPSPEQAQVTLGITLCDFHMVLADFPKVFLY
jgi:hypothetical protein